MASRRSPKARRRWRSLPLTLVGFAALTAAILWLDDRAGETFSGPAKVLDGDSLLIDQTRLRLMGIDAPELRQECQLDGKPWRCGVASKAALQSLLRGRELECQTHGLDRYQRQLAICQAQGVDINARMVEQGWAVDYGGYASEEGMARKNKVGLWQGQFEYPQEWRAANRSQSDAAPASLRDWWKRASSRAGALVWRE